MVGTITEKLNSKYLNGYSREHINCEEFSICAEAREDFELFDKYCVSNNPAGCQHKILTCTDSEFIERKFSLLLNPTKKFS